MSYRNFWKMLFVNILFFEVVMPGNVDDVIALLSKERIENILIFNEIEEQAWRPSISLFDSEKDTLDVFASVFTFSLMDGLANGYMTLCSKSLFKNYLFLSGIWPDLLRLDTKSFRNKYKEKVHNITDKDLESIIKIIREIEEIVVDTNVNLSPSQKNMKIQKLFEKAPHFYESLYYSYLFYRGYQQFKKDNQYNIYAINDEFLLFFPKQKLQKAVVIFNENKNKYKNEFFMFRDFNKFCEIYFGLHIPLANPFIYTENNLNVDFDTEDDFIGESLKDSLKKLFVNNILWQKEIEQKHLPTFLLPRFNILLGGHGQGREYLMELTPDQIHYILKFFNTHIWTKTLMLESCYLGGMNFQNIFGHSYNILNQFTENFTYSILFEGSLYRSTPYFITVKNWINYQNNIQRNFYKVVFDSLALDKNEYFNIVREMNRLVLERDRIYNYISIKFPNTSWIVANDYEKDVFNITKSKVIASSSKKSITIPQDKKIILLNTDYMPLEINLDLYVDFRKHKDFCKFLPVHYSDHLYYISQLTLKNIKSMDYPDIDLELGRALMTLFSVNMKTEEDVLILIDKVVIGKYTLSNVLINFYLGIIYFYNGIGLDAKSMIYYVETDKILNASAVFATHKNSTLKRFNAIKKQKLLGLTVNFKDFVQQLDAKNIAKELPKRIKESRNLIQKIE